ncbi:hypothetical protein TSUD_290120 [Trifolium subterraneum]|uniref:RNase H type-1 domain-containing protein n=1 Tax=Trifolium subterraneum TaxID=3900 RepID=A0A2Z6P9L5_TRISU|nr:hypothetical protein TSUD_290120 [Trifolium subterraneum]
MQRWNLRASTHEGEALAMLNAMEWVQHMSLHSIIFASDSTLLVDAIMLKNVGYSEVNVIATSTRSILE